MAPLGPKQEVIQVAYSKAKGSKGSSGAKPAIKSNMGGKKGSVGGARRAITDSPNSEWGSFKNSGYRKTGKR